ncbi:hypothetical protein [Angustibacter sp. Root456]|uniref:hypothetical protein n=1 Tax=Angustibacter sp. Root456 TaxID=1736539 RepID=UPI0012F7F79F|nr:hypothetical protein [Angustibacter sp. Root456]
MISDSESQELTRQSSSSLLGGGLVVQALGVALVLLWALTAGGSPLALVLGLIAGVGGAVMVAAALVRLAEKFEDVHRMTVAAHQSRVRGEIRELRERS